MVVGCSMNSLALFMTKPHSEIVCKRALTISHFYSVSRAPHKVVLNVLYSCECVFKTGYVCTRYVMVLAVAALRSESGRQTT